jgi:hypothetical protein
MRDGITALLENDPNGLRADESGAKLDLGKNRLGLVLLAFSLALEEVGRVGTFGAEKYSPNGWLAVPDAQARYTDAMLRHVFRHASGEVNDDESGIAHWAHAAWNALACLELQLREVRSRKVRSGGCPE